MMAGSTEAIRILRHGGPEVLERAVVPLPEPGPDEVTLEVTHVALNHLDLWVRRGVPGHDFHLPRVPGSDVVGVVEGRRHALHPSWGCGSCRACLDGRQNRCSRFRIRGESADGGCAAWVVVPRWQLLPVPDGLDSAEAASLPLTLLTAWHMLLVQGGLRRGERVLVQAGGSGVGVMAVQIARLWGCEVHATASSPARRARLAELGAVPLDYAEVGSAHARNYDVVVDSVGRDTWAASTRALAWGGRLLTCGATTGPEVALNLRVLFFKQQSLIGSTMGTSADMQRAWAEVVAGRIRPVVDAVLPMSRIGEAHTRLESRGVFGKLVLAQDLA